MCESKKTKLLDNVYIAAPCSVTWESMVGDDKVRACGGCAKNVFNLSAMTENEAEHFLEENGASQCMIFFRREDGTIMTDNCPQALRRVRDKWRAFAKSASKIAALMLAFLTSGVSAGAQVPQTNTLGPAPPGKKWVSNPAGGGVILVNKDSPLRALPQTPPVIQTPVNTIKSPVRGRPAIHPLTNPTVPKPGKPAVINQSPTGPKVWERPIPAGSPVVPPKVDQKNPPKNEPLGGPRTDKGAYSFYAKGQEAEKKNQTKVAEFYYDKALDFYDAQPTGDAKLRMLIESSLKRVRAKIGSN